MDNDTINQIKDEAIQYGHALTQSGRMHLIGVVSRILGLFLLIFTVVLCVFALFAFFSVAAINAMSQCMPVWAASLIIACVYIILIAVAIACRKPLFIHPFIALMSKQLIRTQEQLDIETLKADHQVDIESIRLETRIDNATREISFYTSLISRIFGWFSKSKK